MRVVFDQQVFSLQRFGGVSRSFVELNNHLNLLEGVESRVIAPLHFNKHLFQSNPLGGIYLPKSTDVFDFNKRVRLLGENISRFIIDRFKPDLVHETFYEPSLFENNKYPIVTTIQDLIREKIGREHQKVQRKRDSVDRASLIICISDSTKRDLLDFYNPDKGKVVRIYLGVNEFFYSSSHESDLSGSKNSILFVGNRSGYKNWGLLVTAFAKSNFLRSEFEIVCFGGGRFSKEELVLLNELRVADRVKQVSGDDKSLKQRYESAACLVYPSQYEGFGLPVVEAMASGCPVVASDIDVLHESGGIAARYFSLNDVDSLKHTLEDLLVDDDALKRMRLEGREHARNFSWLETAKQTFLAYKTIL